MGQPLNTFSRSLRLLILGMLPVSAYFIGGSIGPPVPAFSGFAILLIIFAPFVLLAASAANQTRSHNAWMAEHAKLERRIHELKAQVIELSRRLDKSLQENAEIRADLQREQESLRLSDLEKRQEISKGRRIEELCRQHTARCTALADAAPSLMFTAAADGSFAYINRNWGLYTGIAGEAARDEGWLLAVHPWDLARIKARWQLAIYSGKSFEHEVRLKSAQGGYHWFLMQAAPCGDDAGLACRWVGSFADIEEIKRLEAALQDSGCKISAFLAALAHELRGPLLPMRLNLDVLRKKFAELAASSVSTPTMTFYQMEKQCQVLARLIDDMLDVARLNEGKIILKNEWVDLKEIVMQAVAESELQPNRRHQHFELELGNEAILLECDRMRMEQVITVLLDNAAKYAGEAGHIRCTADVEDEGVNLCINNDGIGMTPETLPLLFDLFAQGEKPGDRIQAGLGLSLNIAYRLVQLHGGSLTARSEGLGKGSTFILKLPAIRASKLLFLTQKKRGGLGISLTHLKVLVVDDNEEIADSLSTVLKDWGIETCKALNGYEALEQARRFKPDVIMLDIGLPGINGYEVARRVREDPGLSETCLVALTGYSSACDHQLAKAVGFDLHLAKPVDPGTLRRLLI